MNIVKFTGTPLDLPLYVYACVYIYIYIYIYILLFFKIKIIMLNIVYLLFSLPCCDGLEMNYQILYRYNCRPVSTCLVNS